MRWEARSDEKCGISVALQMRAGGFGTVVSSLKAQLLQKQNTA